LIHQYNSLRMVYLGGFRRLICPRKCAGLRSPSDLIDE
jgi:hypothetical protein